MNTPSASTRYTAKIIRGTTYYTDNNDFPYRQKEVKCKMFLRSQFRFIKTTKYFIFLTNYS